MLFPAAAAVVRHPWAGAGTAAAAAAGDQLFNFFVVLQIALAILGGGP